MMRVVKNIIDRIKNNKVFDINLSNTFSVVVKDDIIFDGYAYTSGVILTPDVAPDNKINGVLSIHRYVFDNGTVQYVPKFILDSYDYPHSPYRKGDAVLSARRPILRSLVEIPTLYQVIRPGLKVSTPKGDRPDIMAILTNLDITTPIGELQVVTAVQEEYRDYYALKNGGRVIVNNSTINVELPGYGKAWWELSELKEGELLKF